MVIYFRPYETISGYFLLLKVISLYVFFVYCKLFHLKLILAILNDSNIWLLVAIILVVIDGY